MGIFDQASKKTTKKESLFDVAYKPIAEAKKKKEADLSRRLDAGQENIVSEIKRLVPKDITPVTPQQSVSRAVTAAPEPLNPQPLTIGKPVTGALTDADKLAQMKNLSPLVAGFKGFESGYSMGLSNTGTPEQQDLARIAQQAHPIISAGSNLLGMAVGLPTKLQSIGAKLIGKAAVATGIASKVSPIVTGAAKEGIAGAAVFGGQTAIEGGSPMDIAKSAGIGLVTAGAVGGFMGRTAAKAAKAEAAMNQGYKDLAAKITGSGKIAEVKPPIKPLSEPLKPISEPLKPISEVKPEVKSKFNTDIENQILNAKKPTTVGNVGNYLQGKEISKLFELVKDVEIKTIKPIKGKNIEMNGAVAIENGKPVILINPKSSKPLNDVILEEASHAMRTLKGRTTGNVPETISKGGVKAYEETAFEKSAARMVDYAKTLDSGAIKTGATKNLGVIKSVKESPQFANEIKQGVSGETATLANKTVVNDIKNQIKTDIRKVEELANSDVISAHSHEAARQLVLKYQANNDFGKAVDLIDKVALKGTETGRATQIFALWGKLEPEGMALYAKRQFNKFNNKLYKASESELKQISKEVKNKYGIEIQYNSISQLRNAIKKMVDVSPEDLKYFQKQSSVIKGLKEGSDDFKVAVAETMKHIQDKMPSTIARKVATVQSIDLLLRPATAARNVLSNLTFAGAKHVSELHAAAIDTVVSAVTGKGRTVFAPSLTGKVKSAVEGFKLGARDVAKGIDTTGHSELSGLPRGETFKTGIMNKFEKALGYSLKPADRAFYNIAYDESIRQSLKQAGTKNITPEMIAKAEQNGLEATYQNNSVVAKAFVKIKNGLNLGKDFGLGDVILKFPKVPGNIIAQGGDYLGGAGIKGIVKLSKGLRGEGTQLIGKQLVGAELLGAGYLLNKLGIISGAGETKQAGRDLETAQNKAPFSFNASALYRLINSGFDPEAAKPQKGDNLMRYDWLAPISTPVMVGASINKGIQGLGAISDILDVGLNVLTDQTALGNVSKNFTGETTVDKIMNVISTSAKSVPATFVPLSGLMTDIRNIVDKSQRNVSVDTGKKTEDYFTEIGNLIKNKIPGLSKTLPEKVNIAGEVKQMSGNPLVAIFSPVKVEEIKGNEGLQFISDLFEVTKDAGIVPNKAPAKIEITDPKTKVKTVIRLTGEQQADYQRRLAVASDAVIKSLLPKLKVLNEEKQVETLTKALNATGDQLLKKIKGELK